MKHLYALRAIARSRWLLFILVMFGGGSVVHAQVSGAVFRDFDLNGIRSDTLPIEIGVAGVTVRAFVDLSKTPLTTVSDATGNYAFDSSLIPAGKPVRIEFDNLPAQNFDGPFGAGSATRIRFAQSPAEAINLGINYPADFCRFTERVQIVTPCYVNGNSQIVDGIAPENQAAGGDALVGFLYNANGVADSTNFPPVHLATAGEIGTLWGMAYQRRTKTLFGASVLKRHASYGPLGPGGIYQTNIPLGKTTPFVDVRSIGIDVGNDSHSGLSGDKSLPSADPGPLVDAGKKSFGGIDMSEDDKTLYFTNLNDRKLYGLFVDSPARVPTAADVKSWDIPNPGCSNGDYRPWAVKVYRGKVYLGVICSAETSQQQSDLKATIYRVDPTAATPTFETILAFPLDFRRGAVDITTDPDRPQNSCYQYDHWLPWTNVWPTPCGKGENPTFIMHPQPMLTDIEFDDDGSLVIGFLDRFGMIAGDQNHDPNGNGYYDGFTGGDIMRAFNNNGTFELEKNGKAGDRVGSGVGNNEGPVDANKVGGEFYGLDSWVFFGNVAHAEVSNGALTLIPGYNEVLTSAFDPIEGLFKTGGLKAFSNSTGQVNRNYVVYTRVAGSFGKASGLGDSKAMCDPAPVEIGNRFWYDDNRDGIQDAYEPGVDGVALTLHDMADGGKQLASQTTHDGGQYYFNEKTVPGGLKLDHPYEVRMDTTQLSQLDLKVGDGPPSPAGKRTYILSPANRADFANPNERDSDAGFQGSVAVIAVTTRDVGQNDFTNDLAVYSCPQLANELDTIRLCTGVKLDSIVARGNFFSRVDSVRFIAFSSPQSATALYGNTGEVLGTVKPDRSNRAILFNPAMDLTNETAQLSRRYVYTVIYPTPEDPNCRQYDYTVLDIVPALRARALGDTLTCSVTEATLSGSAVYGDGSVATDASYAWAGPNGFTSTSRNPTVSLPGTYTLTVARPNCPSSLTVATAVVVLDTAKPALTATGFSLTCATCSDTLHAEAPGATFVWTGPNGFTSTEADPVVSFPGQYTVVATGANGCTAEATVEVVPFRDPCARGVICVPFVITRR